MADGNGASEPTELVYPPRPTWLPLFVAVGVAAMVVSTFKGWPYAAIGGIFFLVATWRWIADTRDDIARLPREQRPTTAVLPAIPLRRPGADS